MVLNQRKVPILTALTNYSKNDYYSFHMPGHKSGLGISQDLLGAIGTGFFDLDLTELPGLDDLHLPTGCIKEAQLLAAEAFGAQATFFLVNGTSSGIHAALLAVSQEGGQVLIPRNAHRSVMAGLVLSGINPVWIPNTFDTEFFIPLPIAAARYDELIKKHERAGLKAVLAINPTYHGFCSQLGQISKAAHGAGLAVIVDEAHGPHFHFHSKFPSSAMNSGVDIAVQSTHKMLTAANQGAMLHVGRDSIIPAEQVFRQLTILQTTSPSYPILATLDSSRKQMAINGEKLFSEALEMVNGLTEELKKIVGLSLAKTDDPFKILVSVKELGIAGFIAAEFLRKEYRVQVELADVYNILLLFNFSNTKGSIEQLVKALQGLVQATTGKEIGTLGHGGIQISEAYMYEIKGLVASYPMPLCRLTPREAWFSGKKQVKTEEAVGEIAAEMVAPYPPGIPLLGPGEEITPEILEHIKMIKALRIPVQGCEDTALDSISVVTKLGG